jgi:hypothetical protein
LEKLSGDYDMSILHFSGKFKYQPPIYNNEPGNPEKYFDSSMSPDDVQKNITKGVEPLQYFEFEFSDVFIRMITYSDGTTVTDEKDDSVICKKILLKGLLVDTAPHLERGRLFAGEIRILDLLMGKLEIAVQSDLFQTLRNIEFGGAQTLSADFETNLYDISSLQNTFVTSKNSRFLRELASPDLKIYFHVSQFDFKSLEGTIFGYIGPKFPMLNDNGLRLTKRRLLIAPDIDSELVNDLQLEDKDVESRDVFRYDLEATYEILEENRLILMRYLNFIIFVDLNYTVPTGYRFFIVLFDRKKKNETKIDLEILLDSNSIVDSGGVCVVSIPASIETLDKLGVEIVCTKDNGAPKTLLQEPKFDLLLNDEPNYLVLSSGEKKELAFKVFKNNKIMNDLSEVEFNQGQYGHNFSPLVVWTLGKGHSEAGSYVFNIEARNLENSDEVADPIYGVADSESDGFRVKMSGELPWDRYYGNYIFIKMNADGVSNIQQNIPVRVIHSVPLDELKEDVMALDKEKIQEVVTKLMSYYTRYYPWLHVRYRYVNTSEGPKKSYEQFLKIKEFLSFIDEEHLDHWHSVHESISNINHLLERLQLPDHDWKKMPRSRDFPYHGVEFLRLWKGVMVDKLVDNLKQQRKEILESEQSKNLGVESDISDFGALQKIVEGIDAALENVPDGYKKLFFIWKVQLLDRVIKEVTVLKTQTKHTHTH